MKCEKTYWQTNHGNVLVPRSKVNCNKEATTKDSNKRNLCSHHYNQWVKIIQQANVRHICEDCGGDIFEGQKCLGCELGMDR